MYVSNFEQLPDEILLEICTYLKPFDVLNSFGRLNNRLEQAITQYRCDADLHHLIFSQFQRWCDYLLYYTADSIVNLVLSNWNSPGQIYLFNQLIQNYDSLWQIMPNIKQLRLIDFTNNDIDILSKIQRIEKIFIDADALVSLPYSTHILLEKYLFCSSNSFKEIRLWGVEGGIRLQHNVPIEENLHLERLTISVARLDDFVLTFRRAPNLLSFNVEIAQQINNELRQNVTVEMLPKHLTFFHFQTNIQNILCYADLNKLISNISTIELLSFDMDTNDIDFALGYNWKNILLSLPNLKHVVFKIRIWLKSDWTSMDIDSVLESFQQTDLPVCCYLDGKILHIDTVPYDMRRFNTNMSVTTSPRAKLAKTTNTKLFNRRSRRVQTLIIDGQHYPTSINDWISVIERFSGIEILQINAVNIQYEDNPKTFRLPHLGYLHYIRSTNCKVHIPFFLLLANNPSVTPQLKALSMMYGDLIYLCKRLSGCRLERIKELWLYGGDADGHVILKDIDLLLKTFPCLYHFFFNHQSSRFINRHLESMIEMILRSSPQLISFRISCNSSSLQFSSGMDDKMCINWIKQLCAHNHQQKIYATVTKKMLSIWK